MRTECFKCKKPVGPYQPYPLKVDGFANCWTVKCDFCGNTMSTSEIIDPELIEAVHGLADDLGGEHEK